MEQTMKPRIGLLLLGHPDYENDTALHFASQGVEALRQAGLELVLDQTAHLKPLEAAAAARRLLKQDVEGVIIVPGTWLEGDVATAAIREIEHLPFALWGLPMFEWEGQHESTGSFVAVCSLKGPLTRMGYVFKSIIGLPDEAETQSRLTAWAYAAHAAERLKRLRAGLIGYSAMHIYAGMFDHVLLRRHIGPEIVHLDTYTLIREAGRVSPEAVEALAARVKGLASVQASDERLRKACGLGVALQNLVKKHHLDALTVKCQYELSQEYGMTPCLPMALLADEGLVASCEGDVMVLVTQALLRLLTGQVAPYGDILDLQGDAMLLSSCGFAPFSLANESDTCRVCEFDHPGFDGLICSFTLKRGPVTIARLSEGVGNYKLLYATGTGVETDLRQGRFPALQIKLDGDPQALLGNIASQHFALCYGDQSERLEDWCRIAGVEGTRI
jgi:L-fucose isomerase-like protein